MQYSTVTELSRVHLSSEVFENSFLRRRSFKTARGSCALMERWASWHAKHTLMHPDTCIRACLPHSTCTEVTKGCCKSNGNQEQGQEQEQEGEEEDQEQEQEQEEEPCSSTKSYNRIHWSFQCQNTENSDKLGFVSLYHLNMLGSMFY
jgi:hypothetical protein